jgi:uncharacterized protein (TIGR02118 family)
VIKVVGLFRRRKDMTRAQFKEHWLTRHALLEHEIFPGSRMKKIVATFVSQDLMGDVPYDGMVELYFESLEDMQAQFATGTDDKMRADEANFCDPDYRIFAVTEEVVIDER